MYDNNEKYHRTRLESYRDDEIIDFHDFQGIKNRKKNGGLSLKGAKERKREGARF